MTAPRLFPLPSLNITKADGSIQTARVRIVQLENEIPHHVQLAEDIRQSRRVRIDRLAHLKTQLETLMLKRESALSATQEAVKRRRLEDAAATRIQAQVRGRFVRRRGMEAIHNDKRSSEEKQKMLLIEQLGALRRCIHDLAYATNESKQVVSATKIQRWWRRECHRRRLSIAALYTRLREARTVEMIEAQCTLSRWIRRILQNAGTDQSAHIGICRTNTIDCTGIELVEVAAQKIQRYWRLRRSPNTHTRVGVRVQITAPKSPRSRKLPPRIMAPAASRATTVVAARAPAVVVARATMAVAPRITSASRGKISAVVTMASEPKRKPVALRAPVEVKARRSTIAKVVMKKPGKDKEPKKSFFDTSYKEDLASTVKEWYESKKDDSATCSHPLLDSDVLSANPHYLSLARSLFQ